jgi:hypothetical protein
MKSGIFKSMGKAFLRGYKALGLISSGLGGIGERF